MLRDSFGTRQPGNFPRENHGVRQRPPLNRYGQDFKAKLAVREPVGISLLLQAYQAASSAELGSRVSEV